MTDTGNRCDCIDVARLRPWNLAKEFSGHYTSTAVRKTDAREPRRKTARQRRKIAKSTVRKANPGRTGKTNRVSKRVMKLR
jgi:hypothetical protein